MIYIIVHFAAARENSGQIEYLMSWKDFPETVVASFEVKQKWPLLLLDYLEERIQSFTSPNPFVFNFPATQSMNVTGNARKAECK